MTAKSNISPTQIDAILLKGGLDQITPTLTLPNGFARESSNWECSVTGGYARICGYERFDGHPSPTDSSSYANGYRMITVLRYLFIPQIGDVLVASGGASGTVAYISGNIITLTKLNSGIWVTGGLLRVGAMVVGVVYSTDIAPSSPREGAILRALAADIYRNDISAVPGVGPVRGVILYRGDVYAFRDNIDASACAIWRSSSVGWTSVPLYNYVRFTDGSGDVPSDGGTLTKASVSADIKRVVHESGTWDSGTASGKLILGDQTGGSFSAGASLIGSTSLTLGGIETGITLLPGGRFEFDITNFRGQAATSRMYGCDGVNQAFEFDGDVMVPIDTGANPDIPTHIVAHKKYLFLTIGSSLMFSAPGLPYDWTALSGAGEIAVGDTLTGIISMPGGTNTSTLGVCSRNNTYILYGTGLSDWNLISYNTGSGALPYSMQNMAQTFIFDDRGVNSLQTSLQFGNFTQTTLTNQILPYINERVGLLTGSTLCRRKSQYRVFFNDGTGLFITVANNKLMGCMPVSFPNPICCVFEGKQADGTDVIYFGSTNGMIYQMEKGTSFDGADIDYHFILNPSNAKRPRTLKRYRKAVAELTVDNKAYIEFKFSYQLGYDSGGYSQPDEVEYEESAGISKWDSFTWDDFYWDANRINPPLECEIDGTAENIGIALSGLSNYVDSFNINSILIHYTPRRLMR